jgi:uncharacterized protein YpuA (DUF1002 family)
MIHQCRELREVGGLDKRNWTQEVLKTVQKKTGRSITAGALQRIAGQVNRSTLKSEAQLRQLIQQVGKMAGINVTEETMRDLIRTIKNSNVSSGNLLEMLRKLKK